MKSIFHFWGQFDKSTATNMSDFLCNECGYEGMGMASMYWSGLNLTFYRESYGASEKSSEPLRNYLSVWEYKQACAILIERLRNLGASEKCKVAVKHLLKKTFPSVCTKRIRVFGQCPNRPCNFFSGASLTQYPKANTQSNRPKGAKDEVKWFASIADQVQGRL